MRTHGEFRIRVKKDYTVFSSAHFITFAGHRCEALHGHNYRVGVALDGALDEDGWYVLDFSFIKRLMRQLCDEIDHKVLLPTENPKLGIVTTEDTVSVHYEGKQRYVFPARDCRLLPIPNTTVEMLARHLATRLLAELGAANVAHLTAIEMEVEESFGQSATYRGTLA
ncbi:MAG TPA: 6-pyruvoyl tetrahydropterin synthase family protein [Gemmatimonadaceae bacterium]|nr:6-pyruvoyl tetrahydropterin synthase family protein [Gemmatimonadaceae bacterium]